MNSRRTLTPKQIILGFGLLCMTGQVQAETQQDQSLLFCNGEGRCVHRTYNVSSHAALLARGLKAMVRNAGRSASSAALADSINNLESAIRNGVSSTIHDAMAATFTPASELNKIIQGDSDDNKKQKQASIWSHIKPLYILAAQANAKEKAGWDYGWDGYQAAQWVRDKGFSDYLDEITK